MKLFSSAPEKKNLAATKAYYDAGQSGDWELVAKMLAADFVATESSSMHVAGEHRGIEGLKKLYETLFGSMNLTGYEIHQTMAGGEWVVSLMDIHARDSDGSLISMPVAEALRWRGGKLCEMKPYWFDTNLAKRAVEAKKRTG